VFTCCHFDFFDALGEIGILSDLSSLIQFHLEKKGKCRVNLKSFIASWKLATKIGYNAWFFKANIQ